MADKATLVKAALVGKADAPRFSTHVDVTAKRPKKDEPYPENILDIILGSATAPPTGTYLPPTQPASTTITTQDPIVNEAWKELQERYPFVANQVTRLDGADNVRMKGSLGTMLPYPNRPVLQVMQGPERSQYGGKNTPDDMGRTLAHELAHVAQILNFTPGTLDTIFSPKERYGDRLAEQQATAVGAALKKRRK